MITQESLEREPSVEVFRSGDWTPATYVFETKDGLLNFRDADGCLLGVSPERLPELVRRP